MFWYFRMNYGTNVDILCWLQYQATNNLDEYKRSSLFALYFIKEIFGNIGIDF